MLNRYRLWLGLGLTAIFLLLFFYGVDWGELGRAIGEAEYLPVLLGVAIYFLSMVFRAIRWHYLLRPLGTVSARRLYPVVITGYMANNLLPVRLGEVVRAYFLQEREGIKVAPALGSIVVERTFDGVVLLFLLALTWPFLATGGLMEDLAGVARLSSPAFAAAIVAPFLVVLALLFLFGLRPGLAVRWAGVLLAPVPAKLRVRLLSLVETFVSGLRALRSPQAIAVVAGATLGAWLMELAIYWLVAVAFSLDNVFTGGELLGVMVITTAISNLGTSLPSSQGGIGPFELFGAGVLVFFGVGQVLAKAYILVLHAVLIVPLTVMGLVYLWSHNISLARLSRRAADEGDGPPQVKASLERRSRS